MVGLCSTHQRLDLDCKLCRLALPKKLKLYLVVDTYDPSCRVIDRVFFTKDEAESFKQKTNYFAHEIQELEFNTQNGQSNNA